MDPEKYIFELIPKWLKKYDRKKSGVTLDIGVGTYNFYFEIFANAGYKAYAIEPLPTDNLKKVACEKKIELIEACILDYNGKTNIYSGVFRNQECPDVSSVNEDWWGITKESTALEVRCFRLADVIKQFNIGSITYLKIDTEGSEYLIIKQLLELPKQNVPKIIEFEYGGGAEKSKGIGGWNKKYFEKTVNCIEICEKLGFNTLIVFESTNDFPLEFNLQETNNYSKFFQGNFVYGNVVMFQEKTNSFGRRYEKLKQSILKNS